MVWIPGGEFMMGADDPDSWPAERPPHRVRVSGYWIDSTEVTNAQFEAFVAATKYVTTAEHKPDWEELKSSSRPERRNPLTKCSSPLRSSSRHPKGQPGNLEDIHQWWTWTPGADWRHPQGPSSNLQGKENHPVVQVSWDDAVAYAKWAGKTAADGSGVGVRGPRRARTQAILCGATTRIPKRSRNANAWQGVFPSKNTKADGFERTAPVKSYKPNGYGLYDTGGNVWEWCSDWYRFDAYKRMIDEAGGRPIVDPAGPDKAWDPHQPYMPERVMRGGSFLCHPSYCASYRPSARRGNSPDTSTEHLGFSLRDDGGDVASTQKVMRRVLAHAERAGRRSPERGSRESAAVLPDRNW
jgi:formylglycine-generating enzyme required for sulfatase activity